jgi:hypothetical protein
MNVHRPMGRLGISADGLAFLKCAFASPDFGVDPGKGIPDKFQGMVLSIKDCSSVPISFSNTLDTWIIKPSSPGLAYFIGTAAPGSTPTTFTAVTYPTYVTNYGTGLVPELQYTHYRYASSSMGLYSTSNFMSFNGALQVWRVDLNFADELIEVPQNARLGTMSHVTGSADLLNVHDLLKTPASNSTAISVGGGTVWNTDLDTGTVKPARVIPGFVDDGSVGPAAGTTDPIQGSLVARQVTGLESITSLPPRDNYSQSFQQGAFAYCIDRDMFEWQRFNTATKYVNTNNSGSINLEWDGTHRLLGLGNTDALVFKIAAAGSTNQNSAILRVWDCYELKPKTSSALYQFSHMSPAYDPVAMQMYREVAYKMPVAVPSSMNEIQWKRVSEILQALFKMGGYLPGPAGMISSGLGAVTAGIEGLFL